MITIVLIVTGLVGLLVIVVATGLIAQKITVRIHTARDLRLDELYRQKLDPILVGEDNPETRDPDTPGYRRVVETACHPLLTELEDMWILRRRVHRAALKRVMLDMCRILAGDSRVRLVHVFEVAGFVQDELRDLESRKWWKRASACRNLALMGAADAAESLVHLLNDDEEDVRTEAALALITISGARSLDSLLMHLNEISLWTSVRLSNIVLPMGSEAVPALVEGLRSRHPSIQRFCVEMLGEIEDVTACNPLIRFSRKATGELRSKALLTLGKLGSEKAKRVLLDGLEDSVESTRVSAAVALGRLGSPDTAPFLSDHLLHDTVSVRLAAGRSLAMIHREGRRILAQSYRPADAIGRRVILQSLDELGVPEKKLREFER